MKILSIRNAVRLGLIGALLVLGVSGAAAQTADAGIVNQLAGDVTYASGTAAPARAQPFMRVRQGDRFTLGAGGSVRLVYFQGGRQETWKGPVSFRVGAALSEQASGPRPEVTMLPTGVPQKIGRMPELLQSARLGGVTVRGLSSRARPPLSAVEKTEVAEARAIYRKLRTDAAPDDITPELYLFSVLQDYSLYDEMKPVAEDMQKRQPASTEAKELAAWAEKRAAQQSRK